MSSELKSGLLFRAVLPCTLLLGKQALGLERGCPPSTSGLALELSAWDETDLALSTSPYFIQRKIGDFTHPGGSVCGATHTVNAVLTPKDSGGP